MNLLNVGIAQIQGENGHVQLDIKRGLTLYLLSIQRRV